VTGALRAWLAGRSERERRLLGAAAVIAGASIAIAGALTLRDAHAALVARVAGHERELAAVRRLAATVAGARAPGRDDGSMVARLDAAASAAGVADRVASMTPAADGSADGSLALRVTGASLAETVALLHAIEDAGDPVAIARMTLRKHPDDPGRFDVTLDVAGRTAP
jgi:hypothetical protein